MFQNVILMAPGGIIAYCGLMSELPEYFIEAGLATHYEAGSNIADFALQHIKDATSKGKDAHGNDVDIQNRFKESEKYGEIERLLSAGVMPKDEQVGYVGVDMSSAGASWYTETWSLIKRFWLNSLRDRVTLVVRYTLDAFFAFVLVTTFVRMGYS
jgi:hypothetical protein